MSIFNALNTAIYSKLSAGTALVAALGGTAIYYQQAPDGAALPYVVWSHVTGGPLNTNPSDMRYEMTFVRAYAANPTQAGSVDALLSGLLHKQALSITGYTNYWTVREMDQAMVENPQNDRPVYMAGAFYRIKLDD